MSIINIKGRLSFEHIFQPDATEGSAPAYSATILLPKNDPQVEKVKAAIHSVAEAKWKAKTAKVLPQLINGGKTCFRDGDLTDYSNYADMMYLTARNKQRPSTFDAHVNPVVEADGVIYSGCYVEARVELWAQDNTYGKRVNAKLLGVRFIKDGDRFGSGSGPAKAEDFEVLPEEDENEDSPWS